MIPEDKKTKIIQKAYLNSDDACRTAKVAFAYCDRDCLSEEAAELRPVMKHIVRLLENIYLSLSMLAEVQDFEESVIGDLD